MLLVWIVWCRVGCIYLEGVELILERKITMICGFLIWSIISLKKLDNMIKMLGKIDPLECMAIVLILFKTVFMSLVVLQALNILKICINMTRL